MEYLPCIELETARPADATVIWLHGLGADGHDFEPIVPELRLPDSAAIRFIFPHAPSIPVTINAGYVMPAWYDIKAMDLDRHVDEAQLQASAGAIRNFIDREIERGIDSRRIIIAGFSQGGAVAYETALSYPRPLGGLLALSTYFATEKSVQLAEANQGLPIRIYHGSFDPIVPEILGRRSLERLQSLGYDVQYRTYPMEHAVCPQEIGDIASALRECLALDA